MPAFKRFGPGDQIDNVLVLEPTYSLVSGSAGWRGSPEGSASLSLYGGARRSSVRALQAIEYQSIYPNVGQTGNPVRGLPMTASVHLAFVRNEPLSASQRTSERWGEEHFDTLNRLYQDYQAQDPDYVTASYDYNCLYFQGQSRNIVSSPIYTQVSPSVRMAAPTASFTLETWVKPFSTSSVNSDFTLQHLYQYFWFGITGSTGRLTFSSSLGIFASSFGPSTNRWHHVAVSFNSASLTGTFWIDLVHAGNFTLSSSLPSNSPGVNFLNVGNVGEVLPNNNSLFDSGSLRRSFHGFMGETRYWTMFKDWADLSGTHNRRLVTTEKTGSAVVLELLDGPLTKRQWYPGAGNAFVLGSGTQNTGYANVFGWAHLNAFDGVSDGRKGPVWHPNDNIEFYPNKAFAPAFISSSFGGAGTAPNYRSLDLSQMLAVHVPAAFYGRQIVPGSVRMECRAYSSASHGLVRVLVDDGRGGLYLSGSACSSSLANKEDYAGVAWNKVGNVFYGEGLIVIKDPSLHDFGRDDGASAHPSDTFQLSFRGDSRIPVKMLMCRIDRGEFNATANQTFYDVDPDDGSWEPRHASGTVRVTTVGLYNGDRELVGVARLADPVRIRPRDRINIRLRMDF